MLRKLMLLPLLFIAAPAFADAPTTDSTAETSKEPAKPAVKAAGTEDKAAPATAAAPVQPGGDVKMSGMSILGNEDAPKSLVLVPWKSSKLGDMPSVSRLLDASKQPVDKEVFLRELSYYEFKAGTH